MTTKETTTVEIVIGHGNDAVQVTLRGEAVEQLRRDYIRALHDTLREVEEAEKELPELDSGEARYGLEILSDALRRADKAADVLWWVAPENEYEPPAE